MDEASKAQKPVSRWKPHVTYVKTAGAVHRAATSIHPAPYAKYVTFDPFGPDDKDATLGVRTLSVLNTSTRSISSRVIVVNSSDDDGHSNTKEPVQSSQSIFYTKSDGHEIDSESPKASLVRHRKTVQNTTAWSPVFEIITDLDKAEESSGDVQWPLDDAWRY
ncbi:hypothetical protein CGGC5_v017092 [Colletotrichum fructicola Nara gc5]|uniref:Uncharacterized protein n=1 Tax=Colletotrichum fructicola (strain Nara gc5) TaxID=1213859 RepID=A0A7J6IDH4_COLFN|nr:hypothetical protein CGGC5_v017092 [Colletotrichum fructicola Nara gc5]